MTLPLFAQRQQLAPAFLAAIADEADREAVLQVALRRGWAHDSIRAGDVRAVRDWLKDAPAPELLLVDVSGCDDVLAEIDALAEVCDPQTRVIAVGAVNDVRLYRDLLRVGVADYLVRPLTPATLADAFSRAEREPVAEAESAAAKTYAVIGARGGVGATTLAASLAWDLAHQRGQRTVLLDLDLQFGAAALSLDLEPGRGLREILGSPERIDSLLIGSAMVGHDPLLRVLAAEEPLDDDLQVGATALPALIGALSESAQAVVADVPRKADRLCRDALARADGVVVVTDYSLPALRDTQRLLNMLKTLRPQGGVLVVANRTGGQPGALPKAEFERGTGAAVDFELPFDAAGAQQAAEQARPLFSLSTAAGAAEFAMLSARLTGGEAVAPVEAKASWLQRLLGR